MQGLPRTTARLVFVLSLTGLAACSDMGEAPFQPEVPPPEDPGPDPVSFSAVIQPIFDTHCIVCHGTVANAGLDLRSPQSYSNLVGVPSAESAMLRVQPGQPAQSWLYRKLTGTQDIGTEMPPGAPLGADLTDLVRTWIEDGALAD